MKKKIITAALAFTGLGIIGFSILLFLGVFEVQKGGLLIESDPVSTVYINGEEKGKTPYDGLLNPGEVSIRIVPESEGEEVLDDYETKVNIVSGVKTILKRVIRETDEDSSGAIVSFEKLGGDDSSLTIVSVPDNAQVTIDGRVSGYTPLRIKIPAGDHELNVLSEGYLEKKIPIRVYKGYKLTASIKLAKSHEPEPSETGEEVKETIEILDTGTGFLRVRSEPNIASNEVGQVKPGETYEVVEKSENDWYKIKVEVKTNSGESRSFEGWVSGEFIRNTE